MERKYIDKYKVLNLITHSYHEAIKSNINMENEGKTNKARSSEFIKEITNVLEKNIMEMGCSNNIKVFSKSQEKDKDFMLSEFLFDIHVCRVSNLTSPRNKVNINYVVESLIQIESELCDNNTKQPVKDFEKLVCGSECLKIMIISRYTNYEEEVRKILSKVAENIKGEVYLIVIDHPRKWDSANWFNNYLKVYCYNTNSKAFISLDND